MPCFRLLLVKSERVRGTMQRPRCKYCGSQMETVEDMGKGGLYFLDRCPRCGALARFEVRGGQISAVEWVVGIAPGDPIRGVPTVRPWVPEPVGRGKK